MALPIAGAVGIGLVWGWLLGRRTGGRHLARTASVVIGATLLVAGAALLYAGPVGAASFAAAATMAALLHLGQLRRWQEQRRRAATE